MPSSLLWLFPITYLLHIIEEGFAGERFYVWIARILGRSMRASTFFVVNALLLSMMVTAILITPANFAVWLAIVLGTAVLLNGLGHLAATLYTRTYSPGVLTGTLLWVPLGLAVLITSTDTVPRSSLFSAVLAGILVMGMVVLIPFAASRERPPAQHL